MTMQEAIEMHQEQGKHFFDKSAMAFFNSKVESRLFKNLTFVTSERMELDMPKKYTVRQFADNFRSINDISGFQEYSNLDEAVEAAKSYRG